MSAPDIAGGNCATSIPSPPRVSRRKLLVLCAASLACGVTVANWLEGRESVLYGGSLQSLTKTISAQRTARVHELLLVPGQRIVPGDRLLQLTDDDLLGQIADQQRQLVELEADLKRLEAKADVEVAWRKRELSSEIFQTELKLANLGQERISKQVEQLAWQDHLKTLHDDAGGDQIADAVLPVRSVVLDSPFADQRRLQAMVREDAAAAAADSLSSQVVLCEQQLDKLRKLDKELNDKVRVSVGVNVAETRLNRAQEELATLEHQRDELTIISPAHGIVGAIFHRAGDLVTAGQPILELLDDERRHLVACIPSSAATHLRPGTKVELVFPGRQHRIGLVAAIPPHATPADQLADSSDSRVEVKVEPAGKLWPKLPVGSRVQVHVLQ